MKLASKVLFFFVFFIASIQVMSSVVVINLDDEFIVIPTTKIEVEEQLSIPQRLRVPPIVSGYFSVQWDASSGSPDSYELQETKIGAGGYGFKQVYKGLDTFAERFHTSNLLYYRVRACRGSVCTDWSDSAVTKAI